MVIIAILAMLGAVAIPTISGTMPRYQARAEVRELVINLKKARLEALKRNRNVVVEFTPSENGNSSYRIFAEMNGSDLELMNWQLRPNVNLVSADFTEVASSDFVPLTGFNSRGLLLGSHENALSGTGHCIISTRDGKRSYQISLSPAGSISVSNATGASTENGGTGE